MAYGAVPEVEAYECWGSAAAPSIPRRESAPPRWAAANVFTRAFPLRKGVRRVLIGLGEQAAPTG